MDLIQKHHGFEGEKFLVLPDRIVNELIRHPLVSPLFITDIGQFPHAQYHFYDRPEGCSNHIIILCIDGQGRVKINSQSTQTIQPGSCLLIPSGVPHTYAADYNNPWSIFWVHFNGHSSDDYVQYCTSAEQAIYVDVLSVEIIGHLIPLIGEIYQTLERGLTIDHMIYASQVFWHVLGLLGFSRHPDGSHHKEIRNVDQVIALMQTKISGSMSLQELADYAKLSKTQMIHIFKQATGRTPIDFFLHLKIQQACRMLEFTDSTINDIAISLGVADPYYFSRLFKKQMGMSPRKYRQIRTE
jgi:AraC-like DNA-binding protein